MVLFPETITVMVVSVSSHARFSCMRCPHKLHIGRLVPPENPNSLVDSQQPLILSHAPKPTAIRHMTPNDMELFIGYKLSRAADAFYRHQA
jgi:hypothetical protein